jgi:hypothetical protein
MRFSTGLTEITCHSFSNKAELLAHLQVEGHFSLFESSEQEKEFYSIVSQPAFVESRTEKVAVGICSEGHGLSPEVLPLPEKGLFLLGFNERVVAIDSESGDIAFEHKLKSLFWSFAKVPSDQLILVFYEVGVKAIMSDGQELWDYSRDLLKGASREGDTLTLSFSDSPPVALNLSTGQSVKL